MRRTGALDPPLLRSIGTDEYAPPDPTRSDREALASAGSTARSRARKLGLSAARYLSERTGTAASLRAIDAAAGGGFYAIPPEAEADPEAAEEVFSGGELIVDVQTHYIADHRAHAPGARGVLEFIRSVAPDRFRDLDPRTDLSFAEYLRCVFLESETAVALLTAAPGDPAHNILSNAEIAGTRELADRLAGTGRLLHHAIVHPDDPLESGRLGETLDRFRPSGLKVYTLYGSPGARRPGGWMLDDEEVGLPFVAQARDLGVRTICAHKGLSGLASTGSPADIGPVAAAFPELDFLVYHSGYEVPVGDSQEGPYDEECDPASATDAAELAGTDRLLASVRAAGVAPGANVYAELGSTWYILLRRPREAAHVLGKLLRGVGEDNVLWGTDSVWYGPAQPLIDAFRAFQIPEAMCEAYGYPRLTRERKAKILGLNAARVYGLDPARTRQAAASDDLAWVRKALAEAHSRS